MKYYPDRWLLLKVKDTEGVTFYKVLSSSNGGYMGSDHWRLNSGIVNAKIDGSLVIITSESGSEYNCANYGATNLGWSIYLQLIEKFGEDRIIAFMSEKDALAELESAQLLNK